MAQRSHVPKFGNWESEDNVPYTVFFDKARKGRSGGKMINPNDPQENPDMFSNTSPPEHAPPSRTTTRPEEPTGGAAVRPTHEHQMGREDGDLRQFTESPARNDNTNRKAANGSSAYQRHGGHGSGSARPVRRSTGSDHSIDRSPLHPHYQARLAGKDSDSPSREGKNSYDGTHGTPGRSRLKPFTRGDESPDGGAAVPKFGEWDEKNPSSADGFTHIFNKVREERRNLPAKSPSRETLSPYNGRKQNDSEKPKPCCFPWFKK